MAVLWKEQINERVRIIQRVVTTYLLLKSIRPVSVAARSKALVWGRSPAEIVGSNLTGGMSACLLGVLCVAR
jgi:hypothetical protein